MRFDRVAIRLEPRTTSNCLDLAVCFLRQHLAPIGGLWASLAVPACVLTYVLVDRFEFTMSLAIVVFFFATSPLGVLLMCGAAPCTFGEPFTFRGTWARLGWRGFGLLARGLGLRIPIGVGSLFFLFPGWYLALRTGFFVEQAALSRMARHLHDRRTDELLKGEIGDLYVRSAGIFAFCSLLWLVLLIAADFLLKHLFGFPLLLDRLGVDLAYLKDGEGAGYATSFLWGDPVVVTAALAVALLVYPLGRLAWFFVYVDVRVRRDCWDMELQILQEAERLEGGDLQPPPAGPPGSVAVRAAPLLCLLLLSGSIAHADPSPANAFGDDAQVSRDFEEILAGPEFRRLHAEIPHESEKELPEWLQKFLDWLGDLLHGIGKAFSGLGVVAQSLAYAAVAAVCALIIWLVVRAVNRYRERLTTGQRVRGGYEEGEADIPPGDLPADEYLRRAAEQAEKGLFREAIGQLLLGAMSFTERSGLIRFRRGLTHRDYLRALRGRTDQHQALRTIVGVYEPIGFGRRPAQYDHYRTSLDGYQTGFRRPAAQPRPAEEMR